MTTLNELRASVTEDQRKVLNAIWRHQSDGNHNIPKITLRKKLNIDDASLQAILKGLSGDIIFSSSNSEVLRSYRLTYLGYLLAEKGEELEDLLARFLSNVRTQLNANPALNQLDLQTAMAAGFSSEESSFLREMIYRTHFHGNGRPAGLPPGIDEWYSLPNLSELRSYIRRDAMKNYDPENPIGGSPVESEHRTANNHARHLSESEPNLLHAHELYEKVKSLVDGRDASDPATSHLIIETADDAIEEFGNTNQSKKLELKKWRAAAEEALPPGTFKEVGERGQEVLLATLYPKSHRVRKALLYLIGTGILISISVGIYTQFLRPGPKPPEKEGNVSPERKPPDSISINLPEGLTLRRAIKFLAQIDNFTADFKPNCSNKFLDTEVEGGPLMGASTVEIIELLRLRMKNTRRPTNYSVLKKPEKGIYEISCS
jgi:hypothetical protein